MLGERLERARKAAGLSLRALGELAGVSQTAILKYEKNHITPDSKMIIKLSNILKVKSEYFFRSKKFNFSLENIEYRKREITQKSIDLINAKILDKIEKRFELESFFPKLPNDTFKLPLKLPKTIYTYEEIDSIADELRFFWKLGLNPIPNLIDVFESNGIRVFDIDENIDNNFDGLATLVEGKHVIVISKGWPGDRQRFTLAHELGHIVLANRLNKSTEMDDEKAANRFAGAFLLPKYAIKEELGEVRNFIEIKELSYLKQEYGISMQGAFIRAYQTNIIERKQYSILWRMFKNKGWLEKEPGEQLHAEKSYMFNQLIFHALAEKFIGEAKAAEFLDISISELYKIRMMED